MVILYNGSMKFIGDIENKFWVWDGSTMFVDEMPIDITFVNAVDVEFTFGYTAVNGVDDIVYEQNSTDYVFSDDFEVLASSTLAVKPAEEWLLDVWAKIGESEFHYNFRTRIPTPEEAVVPPLAEEV